MSDEYPKLIRMDKLDAFGRPVAEESADPYNRDYSKEPVSFAEARSEKAGDGSIWKPRDVLIQLLREVDSGEVELDQVVIMGVSKPDKEEIYSTTIRHSTRNTREQMGIIEICKHDMLQQNYPRG